MATISQTVVIDCTPEALYDYVTQPWRWHEWHPNSLCAEASVSILRTGDTFTETICVEPLSPLPIKLERHTRYRVKQAIAHTAWTVEGKMRDGWLQIDYRFEASGNQTRFSRTLSYQTRGLSLILMPLLRRRMQGMSARALENLQTKMRGRLS